MYAEALKTSAWLQVLWLREPSPPREQPDVPPPVPSRTWVYCAAPVCGRIKIEKSRKRADPASSAAAKLLLVWDSLIFITQGFFWIAHFCAWSSWHKEGCLRQFAGVVGHRKARRVESMDNSHSKLLAQVQVKKDCWELKMQGHTTIHAVNFPCLSKIKDIGENRRRGNQSKFCVRGNQVNTLEFRHRHLKMAIDGRWNWKPSMDTSTWVLTMGLLPSRESRMQRARCQN